MSDQPTSSNVCGVPEIRADKDVESDIHLALLNDFLLGRSEISVRAKRGAVTLHGSVPTPDLRDSIVEAVSRIPGVLTIDSQISVVG